MTKTRTIFSSSVFATLGGVALIAAAIATSSSAAVTPTAAEKSDRFATVGEEICSTQSWPNISAECVAWRNGDPSQNVRFITLKSSENESRSTTLTRVAVSN